MMTSEETLYDNFNQFFLTFLPLFSQQTNIQQNWQQFLQLLKNKPLDYTKIYTLINRMNQNEERVNHHSANNQLPQEERQNSTSKNTSTLNQLASRSNIAAASSPRPISTVSKQKDNTSLANPTGANNLLNKFSQLDSIQSPKVNLSNLSSQQQLIHKNSLQSHFRQNNQLVTEDFNRHLLLSKTKELLFTLSVSSDKLNAMARLPMISYQKENSSNSHQKSPLKQQQPVMIQPYQVINQHGYNHQPVVKSRGSNHSAEHYTLAAQKAII